MNDLESRGLKDLIREIVEEKLEDFDIRLSMLEEQGSESQEDEDTHFEDVKEGQVSKKEMEALTNPKKAKKEKEIEEESEEDEDSEDYEEDGTDDWSKEYETENE